MAKPALDHPKWAFRLGSNFSSSPHHRLNIWQEILQTRPQGVVTESRHDESRACSCLGDVGGRAAVARAAIRACVGVRRSAHILASTAPCGAIDRHVGEAAGGCHGFAVPPPGYPFVEVQTSGNVVDVIIAGVEAYDPILCIFVPGTTTVDIGALPQGDYTVRVRIRQINPPFDILPPASEADLTVLGAPAPVMVPATSLTALALLAGFLIVLAIAAQANFRCSHPLACPGTPGLAQDGGCPEQHFTHFCRDFTGGGHANPGADS